MRRAIRVLVVGLFALAVLVPANPVASASPLQAGVFAAAVDQPTAAQPTTTAPAGPNLNPEQAPSKSRQKLIIGFFAVVLLVIVFFGHRARNKRRKKAKSATVT
jgi:hypothetical protein